mmetsp:Transcript_83782/g.175269  ORF Transcript_83782/g.175269 Transcript_83782/m.175269 type:complete len:125 (+) Transcript_83782:886-1260(+)
MEEQEADEDEAEDEVKVETLANFEARGPGISSREAWERWDFSEFGNAPASALRPKSAVLLLTMPLLDLEDPGTAAPTLTSQSSSTSSSSAASRQRSLFLFLLFEEDDASTARLIFAGNGCSFEA